jgi:hypothetical protein
MKIGIISDSHDNLKLIEKALAVFKKEGIELLVHAGDLTSPQTLKYFKGFKSIFVKGNCDLDLRQANLEAAKLNFPEIKETAEFELDHKSFLVFHGNDIPLFREAVSSGKYDYIIKGHTHFSENYISNNTRIINPGSICGTGEISIAILNTATEELRKINL